MKLAFIPITLLLIPVMEIATFFVVGQWIGIGWTLAGILITAILGTFLLRKQGMGLMAQARQEVDAGRLPARELVDGLMLLIAGVLLLTPGFVTDALGFLLFLPLIRTIIRSFFMARAQAANAKNPFSSNPNGPHPNVVDLDEADYESRPADGPKTNPQTNKGSPWRESS